MQNRSRRRIALEAARFLADGVETEYLHAKERAVLSLGLSSQTRLPSNRKIKDCVGLITREELGSDEVGRRLQEMRKIALEIMALIEDFDPYLIGSVLTGSISRNSDIDLHAYCDDIESLTNMLEHFGYEGLDIEFVENRKGHFVHVKWTEKNYPIEITVYPWTWRETIFYSSVTGKPMKRIGIAALRKMMKTGSA
ncbi:MAG TPA: hypothetical protein V6C86_22660 [Oculatellaceae cyanobacterium]